MRESVANVEGIGQQRDEGMHVGEGGFEVVGVVEGADGDLAAKVPEFVVVGVEVAADLPAAGAQQAGQGPDQVQVGGSCGDENGHRPTPGR